MGSSISGGGFLSALITAVVVAAAIYFSGGTALAAVGFGAAAGAASLVATSMMSQIGVAAAGDVTDTLSRSTSPQTGLPVIFGGQLPHKNGVSGGSFIYTGTIVPWYNVPNSDSQYLFSEQAVCYAGVEKNINQIYIDNEAILAVPITSDGIVDPNSINPKYRPYLQLEVRFGGDYTSTKSLATQYAGSKWTDKFLGKGIVSISAVIKKTQTSLEQNILVNDQFTMTCEMKGQKIFDLSTGTTFATSNPPSIIYDYMTNGVYGMGIDPGLINLSTFQETAQYCVQMEYYANGSISYSKTYKENIEAILQSFGGILHLHSGQICLTTDRKTLSVASFDENTMFGEVQVSTAGFTDYFNSVDATYTNPDSMYATDVLRIPSDISIDEAIKTDGQVITLARDYSWVYDTDVLTSMVNADVLKAKYSLRTVTFTTSEGWDLKVWDSINVSNTELSISGKFKVLSKDVYSDQENVGYCAITCLEYPDAIFDGTDAGVWSPSGSISYSALTVKAPTNLTVNRKGNMTSGSVVEMDWDASTDAYLRGYYVYYKLSASSNWTFTGSTSTQQTNFEIFSLTDTDQYDFAVAAYNNLGLISTKLTLSNITAAYNFALPSITGLNLVNSTVSAGVTDSGDFNMAWNNQSNLVVNGKTFSQYFKNYEVRIYDGATLAYTYYTQQPSFSFTFEMNALKIRKPTIGVIANGFTSGTYSAMVSLTVENKQHAAMTGGYNIASGYKALFLNWDETKIERDYAGTYISIQNTATSAVTVMNTNSTQFTSFNLTEGTYKVKLAHFDIFGIDNLNYTPESTIVVSGDYSFSPEDVDNINEILELDDRLQSTLDNAVDIANSNTSTVVTNATNNINATTDSKISATQQTLTTQFTTADTALSQKIDTTNTNLGTTNANVTSLTQTVATNNTAQSTAITQLTSSVNGQFGSVNSQMLTKADTSTVNSSYSMSVNANGTVAGFKLLASTGAVNTSAIYFTADKFVIAPSTGVTTNARAPFAVSGGLVYLNNAVIATASIGTALISDASITNAKIVDASITTAKIQDASITNAKIGNVIQSNNYVSNSTGWSINKDGSIQINGSGGTGRMVIQSNIIQIFDNNGTLRVRMGLW